ncbi:CD109 antigen [Microplitis demolitor]|uniref:CD109 antigen n=1 Tax=Microplitis demolitor TaxID=69319 RepID=UPI0004CD861C|nr:CD109 antigen [Microplitis demolitor]
MWFLLLVLLLAPINGQLSQNEYEVTSNLPWNNRYDESNNARDQNQQWNNRYDDSNDSRDQNLQWNNRYDDNFNTRDQNPGFSFPRTNNDNLILKEATYFVVASRLCRPGQIYRLAVDVLRSVLPMTVRASVQRNGVEVGSDYKEIKEGIPENLMIQIPPTLVSGDFKLRVEGLYNGLTGGQAFLNETKLVFSQRAMTIFIQMDKPVYMQGQTVRFRAVPINTELKAFIDPVNVLMLDPHGRIMRRWISRQSNLGTVSLSYQLSDQPIFGDWKIVVEAQGQKEEKNFTVEEYYQTRFEVNVTMPAFFFDRDPYIHGVIQANYTSGAPVRGNLTIKAVIKPLNLFRSSQSTPLEFYFNFNEYYPAWFKQPEIYQNYPVMRFFNGTYRFQYPMYELLSRSSVADGLEVQIIATVGESFLNEVIVGYSTARIFNSTVRIHFSGGSPQIFKPAMPYTLNLVASYHDGSALKASKLWNAQMEIRADIESRGGSRSLDTQYLRVSPDHEAVWSMKIDLRHQLGLGDNPQQVQKALNEIKSVRVHASFIDGEGERANAELLLLAHESPNNKNIKLSTSTKHPKVGDYLVLHVQTNYYIETFNYIIMSKGTILLTGQDVMEPNIKTFSIPLSSEMAPVATAVVYHVGRYGDVVADSLTIPVNGISGNNFTVFINNKKAKTGEKVEVAIYGEPGAYVALSGIDRAFYSMQAGNELTYANVISKMSYFGEETNGTHTHSWFFHSGDPDDAVFFPSSSFGIDVNRTFEYIGLVVFTDASIHRRPDNCNRTQGYGECLSGRCYRLEKHCDGIFDCDDGTDEARCKTGNATDLALFRKNRFNRIQRQYDNVWLWKDINIGPHGRKIFNIDVPRRPVHWMVTVFSMSPNRGFGMLPKAIEYTGVLPFFINVEMPTHCRQGEQVGVRVSVFNYLPYNIEATVILADSRDYKFVHVEEDGIVRSYNPRTSFGEHQFFIWIPAQDAVIVYLPIVPVRLGDIKVKVYALTIIGKDTVERTIHVESDGIPQYRHQSILLDLSTRGLLTLHMHVNLTATPEVSYAEDRYYVYGSNRAKISVVGDVVGPIFDTMPVNSTSLLGLPMDCAEQNMFSFAAHMYTTLYMRWVNQRNLKREKESFNYMNVAYQRQLSFMNPDGSFSLFRSDWNQSSSSVWLTAFCARIFQEANFAEWENYLYIDPEVIKASINWLLKYQTQEGSFYEITWLPDRKVNSSFDDEFDFIRHRNLSLTAHVLITLVSVKDLSGELGTRVALSEAKAIRWLEINLKHLDTHGSPYEIAIVAYALSLAKSSSAEYAFSVLNSRLIEEEGFMYWGRQRLPPLPSKQENNRPYHLPRLPYAYDAENIETTAYALLIYVARQETKIDGIVRWLNSQRLTDGGWASTQDTMWAMKALMQYTSKSRLREVSQLTLKVEPTALGGQVKRFEINEKNIAKLQSFDIPEAWGTVQMIIEGSGYVIIQMSVQYNVDLQKFQTEPPVKAFDLVVRHNSYGRNQSHINYLSCQRWTNINESERSGMAVLDVTIPTGYIIQQQNLDAYVRAREVRNLQRARFTERKVLFYFDYLDDEETCVNFTIERWYPVANMSRYLAVRVYDYYAPERFNETIFDALSTYLLNVCEVCGSSQCPYCPIYNAAMTLSTPAVFIIVISLFFTNIRYFRTQEFSIG